MCQWKFFVLTYRAKKSASSVVSAAERSRVASDARFVGVPSGAVLRDLRSTWSMVPAPYAAVGRSAFAAKAEISAATPLPVRVLRRYPLDHLDPLPPTPTS